MASITGSCHCKSTTYAIALPTETLPLQGTYDHRTALRLSVGFHCILYAPIPEACLKLEESAHARLKTYSSAFGTLDFCGVCGTTLFFRDKEDQGVIKLLASTIDIAASTTGGADSASSLRRFVVPKEHIYVDETFCGGVSRFMNDGLPRFRFARGELWKLVSQVSQVSPNPEHAKTPLTGGCHCRGVGFTIIRPDETYTEDSVLKEWVKPGKKYCASYCFCHSCRAVSGAPFWVWAFVPRKQIFFTADDTLQIYESFKNSTRNVTRRFCSRCGCHLFFTSSNTSGRMWDVAVAAVDQEAYESGDWFTWRFDHETGEAEVDGYIDSWKDGRMGFENFGEEYCREMVEEVISGLRQNLH